MDETLTLSPLLRPFPRERSSPGWVPFPRTKRKARMAGLSEYDSDFGPAPPKQIAVDEKVAGDILKDGYLYNPNQQTPVKENKTEPPMPADEEMEETSENVNSEYIRRPGSSLTKNSAKSQCGECDAEDLEEVERHDSRESSLHESQANSLAPDLKSLSSLNSVSLILSDEIQESLARRKLNEDLILPKLITDKIKQENSMALVLWKPPVAPTPLDFQKLKEVTPPSNAQMEISELPLPITTDLNQTRENKPEEMPYPIPILSMDPISPTSFNIDEDYVEMDTSP